MEFPAAPVNSLLYTFFINLRRAGFPLGVEEYKLLLHALRDRYVVNNKTTLLQLCRLLWLKSQKDQADFEHIFQIAFAGLPETLVAAADVAKPSEEEIPPEEKTPKATPETPSEPAKKEEPPIEPPPSDAPLPKPAPLPSAATDEAASLRIRLQAQTAPEEDVLEKEARDRFALQRDYLPVTQRQMTDIWRRIGNTHPLSRLLEFDVESTVRDICQTGFFTRAAFRPVRQHNRLLILTDHEGSMTAFEALANRLVETARRLSFRRDVRRFYFHDVPGDKVYEDPLYTRGQELSQLLGVANSPFDSLLLFSDAGAARGKEELERIGQTVDFLRKARAWTGRIVWVNPMPRHRWRRTPAAVIAKYVPMYSVEEREIKQAILNLI